ncbi:DUF3054 domain-containing protein [Microbacterium sp. NPDC055910]|uniref:DUF3054 domain-containing protein n=1 Tax=Microbacterium sp. NPDC055910 TaxID=3345659 RepID=UPI0035DBA83D
MTSNQSGGAVDAAPSYPAKPLILSFLIDAVLVTIFAAIGRASHDDHPLIGLWDTAWTFLLALVIAWGVSLAWRAPMAPVRTGLPVWAITVAGAMLLRILSGQGTQFAFVIVAASVLLVMLVGWRLIAGLVTRAR